MKLHACKLSLTLLLSHRVIESNVCRLNAPTEAQFVVSAYDKSAVLGRLCRIVLSAFIVWLSKRRLSSLSESDSVLF